MGFTAMMAFGLLAAAPAAADPAPHIWRPHSWGRTVDCERMNNQEASRRFPGRVKAPEARGDDIEAQTVVCTQRIVRPGLRDPADEAILSTLDDQAGALAKEAASVRSDLEGRTWLVEAFYPNGAVAAKIDFATQNALMQQGLRVSDRAPLLAAGDLDVLMRMAPLDAFAAACTRYGATEALRSSDALLAVVQLDPRETLLHAGVCADGVWEWLQ